MKTDPNNDIVKLCAQGMNLEGEGKNEEALKLFQQAWNLATNAKEKFIAAHYVARQQKNVSDKLKWDETALNLALEINEDDIKGTYPSLYLNIGKCYEDLNDLDKAKKHYQLALSYTGFLSNDGYGEMIKSGIENGINRVTE
ncbi:rRNA adenine methyltransferase [Chitinophaga sp. MM2321]|uniref:tetratricopeptide repeat protein n=1 Tax=Chitinophaga sp. MM2321 TaxID=3137178 RepID=UPI0032D5B0FD